MQESLSFKWVDSLYYWQSSYIVAWCSNKYQEHLLDYFMDRQNICSLILNIAIIHNCMWSRNCSLRLFVVLYNFYHKVCTEFTRKLRELRNGIQPCQHGGCKTELRSHRLCSADCLSKHCLDTDCEQEQLHKMSDSSPPLLRAPVPVVRWAHQALVTLLNMRRELVHTDWLQIMFSDNLFRKNEVSRQSGEDKLTALFRQEWRYHNMGEQE